MLPLSAQHASGGGLTVQRQQVQRSIAQSLTLHHLGTPPFR